MRQLSKVGLKLNSLETEGVNKFKEKLEAGNEKDALDEVKSCESKKVAVKMLDIALETRNNNLIIKVLQEALLKENIDNFKSNTDETDHPREQICSTEVFKKAVMTVTLNDDHESLKAVLQWGKNNDQQENALKMNDNNQTEGKDMNCPIIYASLQNYTQCMNELYKFGYKIALPDEDKERIEKVLKMNDAV